MTDAELVVFSPLPPRRSGIAAYTAELMPALGRHFRSVVVVARDAEAQPIEGAAAVIGERGYRAAPALHRLPHLHQLGNNLDHAHVYRAALARPGIVVMHEPVLHHLVEAMTLGRGSMAAYEAALVAEYGAAGRRVARLRRAGLFSPWQRFLMPLHRPVLDAAQGVIVHSRFAAARLQGPPDLPVRVVPHFLSPRVAALDGVTRAEARARLGLPAATPVLLSLGHATPAKRIAAVLDALVLLRAQGLACHHVIGGEAAPELDLAAAIAARGLEAQVTLTGWLPEPAFFLHLRAADLLLALRFPQAGESSGTLARALGMGTPALAEDFGPAAEYPDAVLAKLPFAPAPAPAIAARVAALLADPVALAAQGAAARRHMGETCGVDAAAAAYAEAIRKMAMAPRGAATPVARC